MNNFEFEIRLPYPEKIINKIKYLIKKEEDRKKEEQKIKHLQEKNYRAFVKENPFIEKIIQKLRYFACFGIILLLIIVFAEHLLPDNKTNLVSSFKEGVFYFGLFAIFFSFFVILLIQVLADNLKGKKLYFFNNKGKKSTNKN